MKILGFSVRNTKEIIRDKINLFFGIGFPIIIMLLLTFIQSHMPVEVFSISSLTPGIAVFGLSFISLFSVVLVASDRGSSFLVRLFSSPMKPYEYILGYIIPLIVMSLLQCVICYATAIILGLEISARILLAIIVLFPAIIFFICFGVLMGSILNERQAGGVCGALLTNLTAWLSGTWFSLDLLGSTVKNIAYIFPFANAVDAGRAALSGNFSDITKPLIIVCIHTILMMGLSIYTFRKKMLE